MLALLAVFFRYAGVGIVAVDSPEKADLIIVLMGSGPDRILGAVELYEQGYWTLKRTMRITICLMT